MKKNFWLSLFVVLFFTHGQFAEAQQTTKIPRIGFLSSTANRFAFEQFRLRMRELGYIEGKNIVIEYRTAKARQELIPGLVNELVELKVDVIVSTAQPAIERAKLATKTIPIVMIATFDPVTTGLIDSLARPGGNITGISTLVRELSGKRLELLKEAVPGTSRVGLLWDPNAPGPVIAIKEYEAVAPALKIQLQSLEVRLPNPDFDGAFQAATKSRANALIAISNSLINQFQRPIAELAIRNRLPSMCESSDFVEFGCLMSYSANSADNYKRAAVMVDKILKGTKPADIPVEQPMKFDLVFNLKTANQIGITIPQWPLMKADRVIR